MAKTLDFNDFESRCRIQAELLEKELGGFSNLSQDWGLAISATSRFLWQQKDKERGWYLGVVLPTKGRGWAVPMVKVNQRVATSDEPEK